MNFLLLYGLALLINVVYVSGYCNVPYVAHANVTGGRNNFSASDTVEIICDRGYRFPNIKTSVIYVQCSDNGSWKDVQGYESIPPCERIGSCPVPQIKNGIVHHKDGGYMPNEEAPIQCKEGYEIRTYGLEAHAVCLSDGSWRTLDGSNDLPSCEAQECSINKLENGYVQLGRMSQNDFLITDSVAAGHYVKNGTHIEFKCYPEYSLTTETKTSVCELGKWSTAWPQCVSNTLQMGCPMPETVEHAEFGLYGLEEGEVIPEGATVAYYCNPGYRINGTSTRVCRAGQWTGVLPHCVSSAGGCENPPQIENGEFHCFDGLSSICDTNTFTNGTSVHYYCDNGYKMPSGASKLTCMGDHWEGSLPVCEKRKNCDQPMDIPHGNWWIDSTYPDYRTGSRIIYQCDPGYKALSGEFKVNVTCLESGYWSDYAPRCLPIDLYCAEPASLHNGFYMCKPDHCNLFKVGTEIKYACNKGYRLNKEQTNPVVCRAGGWLFGPSELYCIPELHASDEKESDKMNSGGAVSTITVVISTSCSVLGLLIIVMIIFLFMKRKSPLHRCRGRNTHHGYMPPPPPAYSEAAQEARLDTAIVSEHDRTALISFADGTQATLPSYDEVTRGRYPPRLHRFNSDASRGSRTGSDFRPLPSISHQMRHGGAARELSPDQRDQQSISSYPRGDALSVTFGSIDTMNVSDNTSTTVTLGTCESGASNPSLAASQRATVGSMNSSNPSLVTDDAPLLEGQDTLSHRSQTASPSIPEEEEEAVPK